MSNLVHHEGLIVPAHVIENREPPKEFVKRLQLIFGRDLHVTWHVMKKRFVI